MGVWMMSGWPNVILDVANEVIMPKQVLKVQNVRQYFARAFSPSGLVKAKNGEKQQNEKLGWPFFEDRDLFFYFSALFSCG